MVTGIGVGVLQILLRAHAAQVAMPYLNDHNHKAEKTLDQTTTPNTKSRLPTPLRPSALSAPPAPPAPSSPLGHRHRSAPQTLRRAHDPTFSTHLLRPLP